MSEAEVFGTNIYSSSGYDTGNANSQLPLFRLIPYLKNSAQQYWLRNVGTSMTFCCVTGGAANVGAAGLTLNVRPRFVIG